MVAPIVVVSVVVCAEVVCSVVVCAVVAAVSVPPVRTSSTFSAFSVDVPVSFSAESAFACSALSVAFSSFCVCADSSLAYSYASPVGSPAAASSAMANASSSDT